jgi:hypothetical protein
LLEVPLLEVWYLMFRKLLIIGVCPGVGAGPVIGIGAGAGAGMNVGVAVRRAKVRTLTF